MKHVSKLVFSGKLQPIVSQRFDFDQISKAHEVLEERRAFGKLLLRINYI